MKDLTYEETVELEANVKIKNQADQLYSDFMKYFTLKVGTFKDGRFKLWSDDHNAAYLAVSKDGFVYQGRFLHETYDVSVTPGSLFSYIKNKYRGLEHFKSAVDSMKREGTK